MESLIARKETLVVMGAVERIFLFSSSLGDSGGI